MSLMQMKSKKSGGAGEDAGLRWTLAEVKTVEDRFLALGPNRSADVRAQVGLLSLTSSTFMYCCEAGRA